MVPELVATAELHGTKTVLVTVTGKTVVFVITDVVVSVTWLVVVLVVTGAEKVLIEGLLCE